MAVVLVVVMIVVEVALMDFESLPMITKVFGSKYDLFYSSSNF